MIWMAAIKGASSMTYRAAVQNRVSTKNSTEEIGFLFRTTISPEKRARAANKMKKKASMVI